MATIEQDYADARPKSKALHGRAVQRMPSGVAHDGRSFAPFPFYVARADGARRWDVDGHEYIDCWSGHGALMLGHNHPAVLKAIQEQARLGTHYSACSEIEVRWAELICSIVPGAERVRFMMTGTETTALAIRVARAVTGRRHLVKFEAHFHGLHDAVMAAVKDPFEIPVSAGVPPSTLSTTLVARNNDLAHVTELLDDHEVAAVILEPAGARSMTVPTDPAFLKALGQLPRELNRLGDRLRGAMNEVLKTRGVPGCVYGASSIFRMFLGASAEELGIATYRMDATRLDRGMGPVGGTLHLAMLLNGVDYSRGASHGWMNGAMSEKDVDQVIEAFDRSILRLREDKRV